MYSQVRSHFRVQVALVYLSVRGGGGMVRETEKQRNRERHVMSCGVMLFVRVV
jgi:hypothetical protein